MAAEAPFFLSNLVVSENPTGWGPTSPATVYEGIPYANFSRFDSLSHIADWNLPSAQDRARTYQNLAHNRFMSVDTAYKFALDEEEGQFHVVDNRPSLHRPRHNFPRRTVPPRRNQDGGRRNKGGQQRRNNNRNQRWEDKPQRVRAASVAVQETWKLTDTLPFSQFQKVSASTPAASDIAFYGATHLYDRSFERTSVKFEKRVPVMDVVAMSPTTLDDPVIREIAGDYSEEPGATVFATSTIVSTLMSALRSVYPWDIVITKVGGLIFLDKSDNDKEYVHTNETAQDPPSDDKNAENNAWSLAEEATRINRIFSKWVVTKEKTEFENPSPFEEVEGQPSVAYRYRVFKFADNIRLVVRTELDAAYEGPDKQIQYATIRALNEVDPRANNVSWRQRLDTQRAAVLAQEMKNNANKITKWTVQAILSGSSSVKLGYVSRTTPGALAGHVLLGVQSYKPTELSQQLGMNLENMWGTLKSIIGVLAAKEDGKYVLMKEPNAAEIKVYNVPDASGDDDEEVEVDA